MNTTRARVGLVVWTLLGFSACGSDPAGPTGPGQLKVALRTLFGRDDAAAFVELTGPGINAVTAIDGELFSSRSGNTVRIVVLPNEPGVIEFLVDVDDRSIPPDARLMEVAGGDNRLRSNAGYWFAIQPLDAMVGSRTQR
ncbi:MAG: hypothetical protein JSW71_18805 [Gemmatimonadota bacterium]|nr:MAG: hypothetical protein JSW71_18805 [Gemmatimonadota bacterium]